MQNLAIFASGSGTNFEAIVDACENGKIAAKVVLLVCDKKDAFVLQRAENHNVPAFVFNAKDFSEKSEYETKIVEILKEKSVDLICLAGYMRIVGETLLRAFPQKILNIHPALLPSFKGTHAIDDAWNFGVKVFGVTVHLIDDTIDGGTIISQRAFEYHGNSRDEVEQKIHEIEHQLFPEAIKLKIKN
ncbi:MAG: phosphoribosylglycinamide formyltransferase [Prevotellaceae bacterium]|jgi:phosphoribosylglycinamide formyltransferase-1|nr:phosphoribosylglycinamide formyltransferase [Prevotellaceae bacterium]